MKVDGDIISLSRIEAKELINKECQRRLGMSVAEFLWKYRHSEFLDESAPNDIRMLLRLVYK